MKLSLNWLKEFVEVPADPRELKRRLTDVGLGVESAVAFDSDWVLEAEITTNRPDCLSHYGVAREIATAYRKPLKKIEVVLKEPGPPAAEAISIEIQNPELCARYCGRVIRRVSVKPSPEWLVKRLHAVGVRSINNVADVTNYVLMELGHPLHAFDLDRIRGRQIIVRRARAGEMLRTLDGVDRKLREENLVIADAERAVALAGVMGGEESGISDLTKTVLLESAWFDPLSVRRAAKSQGLHTEASHRFERGADIAMAPLALDRAAALVAELAGGEILRGAVDIYPHPLRREKLSLRRTEIQRLLGAEIPWEDVERILRSLGFEVGRRGTEGWGVTPPSFRLDVIGEADLIEEVARHYGYDHLPARVVAAPPRVERDLPREKELALTRTLVSLGYREIITSSMVDPAENARFNDAPSVTLENPLSQEASALRTTAVPNMLRALLWNLDRDHKDLHLFEMGQVYWRDADGRPRERRSLTLALTGRARPPRLGDGSREIDFYDLKGDMEALFAAFEHSELRFLARPGSAYDPAAGGRYIDDDGDLALFGRLAPEIAADHKLRAPVWLAEIELEKLLSWPLRKKGFHSFSKFPAVERDFSLVVPSEVAFAHIAGAIRGAAPPELAGFSPVDLFHDGALGRKHYSLLLRVTFQSLERTLNSQEITAASQKILDSLMALGIRLRE